MKVWVVMLITGDFRKELYATLESGDLLVYNPNFLLKNNSYLGIKTAA